MTFASDIFSNAQSGFNARLNGFVTTFQDRRAKRRVFNQTLAELSTLSNRELADLGLARSEIRRIAWQAAYQD
jgi:uncharacterized protein YjiS (DUF1127 family)